MKRMFTEAQIREAVMQYPEGCADQKIAFLESLGVAMEPINIRISFTITVPRYDDDGDENSAEVAAEAIGRVMDESLEDVAFQMASAANWGHVTMGIVSAHEEI